ncbi:MAG: amidohydrolase family protein [Candidatus Aminicenantes bacterium]|nr:amidohydrolase family protein [Candidatus Aminicenantes bacterium]
MKGLAFISILFFSLALAWQTNLKREVADLVLLNGAIWTVNSAQPWAEAVAIKGGKILEAGSSQEISKMIGDSTQVVDLKGDLVLPGFIDSHTHFLDGGFSLLSVRLKDAGSREEFIRRIEDRAKEIGKGAWILEGDWDHQSFDPPELPRKEWIDPVTLHNPVCVSRHDGHMVLVNSLALKLAGVTKDTLHPLGGEIIKDPNTGEPTGILKDAAMDLVMRHIPEPSFKEKLKAAEVALKHAAELGVTSIHDMAYAGNFEVYQELLRLNKLTARLYVYIPITEVEVYARLRLKTPFGNNLLKIGGLKGFVDGSLGSSTALFFDPYSDDPQKKGLLHSQMFPEGIMEKRIIQADKAGLQVAIHAIGDKGNNLLLDIFERIIAKSEKRDRRWRIEHAQHLLPADIERIANLDIVASVQPYHAIDDGRWAERKIGRKRCQYTYAFKSLLEKGVILACGSDWTVAPLDPISGIYAAVTRQTLDGKHPEGWFPEQKISLEEAVKGYTLNGAYAEFSENIKGSVEKEKLADLVVLSRNIFKIPPEEIKKTEVKMTILNGKVIYKK